MGCNYSKQKAKSSKVYDPKKDAFRRSLGNLKESLEKEEKNSVVSNKNASEKEKIKHVERILGL